MGDCPCPSPAGKPRPAGKPSVRGGSTAYAPVPCLPLVGFSETERLHYGNSDVSSTLSFLFHNKSTCRCVPTKMYTGTESAPKVTGGPPCLYGGRSLSQLPQSSHVHTPHQSLVQKSLLRVKPQPIRPRRHNHFPLTAPCNQFTNIFILILSNFPPF